MSRLTRLVPALLLALAPLGASACVATAAWYPPRPMVDRDDRAFYNRGFYLRALRDEGSGPFRLANDFAVQLDGHTRGIHVQPG